ncbi:MAG: hypothetical protein PVI67_06130 [Anaerolineae bacterium]
MSEIQPMDPGQQKPSKGSNRIYIIAAAVLLVVIVVTTVLLITEGIPALLGDKEPTPTAEEPSATQVATFTPGPTAGPTSTALPTEAPTYPPPSMADTDTPLYEYQSAGARPGEAWTGFFGQVLDAAGEPLEGVPVIVWYRDGTPASPPTPTDQDGNYEIILADGPLAGTWTIQLLTEDLQPASTLFTFETDENTETGIQQIQVIWQQIP